MIPSPKMILGAGVILAVVGYMAYDLYSDNQKESQRNAERQALLDMTQIAQQEASRADAADTARNIAEATATNLRASLAASQEAQKKINAEFTEFRLTAAEKEAVLDNPKFDKVFEGKLDIFVDLANKATEKQFKDMEELLDGS